MSTGPLELPSASSAKALVEGEPGALPRVLMHMLGRALLVGVGVWAAGGGEKTPQLALGGSMAIEAFVLYYAWKDSQKA